MPNNDYSDDWMNPPPNTWSEPAPRGRKAVEYIIERERRIQGPLTEWQKWDEYETAAKRDKALAALMDEHPMWRLRSRDRYPHLEQTIAIL